jgi:hypothetical protein
MLVASLVALGACLGAENLHAQAATPCTYYVSPNGNDNSTGKSLSTAFATLQAAHDYIFNYDTTLAKKPINVCVEAGTYYASDYNTGFSTQSTSYAVLNIYLSGAPNAEVTFEADPATNPYVLIVSTGWDAINIAPQAIYNNSGDYTRTAVPQYVTVNGLNVQGEGSYINGNSTLKSYALSRTNPNQQGQAFYDGNCVGIIGVPQGTNSIWGIPSHITISNNVITGCVGGGIAANQSDYVNITGNTVAYCSWWSIYGTSGISLFRSVDSDNKTGITKNYVTGNWVTGNYENVPWTSAGTITDGEGIIIDSNLNSAFVDGPVQFTNSANGNAVNVPAYASRTLIANNVIWGNGSSAIEVYQSQHVDVEANSTYANVWEQYAPANFQGRGELSLNLIADVNVENNVFESVAPSYANDPTTSYPLCATNIIPNSSVYGTGYVWFENNVYYAGAGQTVSFPTSGSACQPNLKYPQVFDELTKVKTEWWNLNPLYENTTTSGWPPRVDLGVQDSTTGQNGCTSGGAVCGAPATDILLKKRDYPGPTYPSGAYANLYE